MTRIKGIAIAFLLVVLIIATFLPSPLRPIVILLCCGGACWITFACYTPWEETPEIKASEDPPTFEANDLIQRYGVEQTPKNQKIEK